RVRDERDIDSVRKWSCGHEPEGFLRAHLPVTAVDEYQHRPTRSCGEIVDAVALGGAVTQVDVARAFGRQGLAACSPSVENGRAVGDVYAVVVRRVERGTVHAAIGDHGARVSVPTPL